MLGRATHSFCIHRKNKVEEYKEERMRVRKNLFSLGYVILLLNMVTLELLFSSFSLCTAGMLYPLSAGTIHYPLFLIFHGVEARLFGAVVERRFAVRFNMDPYPSSAGGTRSGLGLSVLVYEKLVCS